ncbi:hypothetical protein L596_010169 [Steinernema carpocapsae]|uniref:Uncharacterized protein n=1 Tax=Steinernema carpocapsae TaxID=34508 RepID=A0A4U5PI10_STECR|nr:hypothetical protein L596_010169 [Steinernema carpocapsae]
MDFQKLKENVDILCKRVMDDGSVDKFYNDLIRPKTNAHAHTEGRKKRPEPEATLRANMRKDGRGYQSEKYKTAVRQALREAMEKMKLEYSEEQPKKIEEVKEEPQEPQKPREVLEPKSEPEERTPMLPWMASMSRMMPEVPLNKTPQHLKRFKEVKASYTAALEDSGIQPPPEKVPTETHKLLPDNFNLVHFRKVELFDDEKLVEFARRFGYKQEDPLSDIDEPPALEEQQGGLPKLHDE